MYDSGIKISHENSIMPKNQLKLKLSLFILFFVVLCYISTVRCDTAVVAHFDADGVKGDVTFKKSNPSSSTNVTISLQGLTSAADWKITSNFLNSNGDNNCSSSNIGTIYNPFQVMGHFTDILTILCISVNLIYS